MKTILAIDDTIDNLIALKAVFKQFLPECNVITATSGNEGIEMAKAQQPDAILLDILMPAMDGYQACRLLKAENQTMHIPIIMITATKTDTASRIRGLSMGADAFLSKPFDPSELSAQVKVMLRIKAAEDKLRAERDMLDDKVNSSLEQLKFQAAVLENVSDAIISTDLNLNIRSWNDEAVQLYGYQENKVLGHPLFDVLKIELDAFNRQLLIRKIFNGEKVRGEFVHSTIDGDKIDLFSSFSLIYNKNGEKIGVVAANRNITEQKENEKELAKYRKGLEKLVDERTKELHVSEQNLIKAKEMAESANLAKSAFLANMSHEIRTPMNAVLGFSELLQKQITNETQLEYLSAIKNSGQTLLSIINDILDISKIEAGVIVLKETSTNIPALLSEIHTIFKLSLNSKKLDFNTVLPDNFPTPVMDEFRLRQILINLMSNAIKFTEKGVIEIAFEVISNNHDRFDFMISVNDTGIGIPKHSQKLIFESFRQHDDQDDRKYGGTGLGLSICKKLATCMGGDISLQSIENIGSKFSVTFRNVAISNANLNDPNLQNAPSQLTVFDSAKILIVDDNKDNLALLRTILAPFNFDILEATNGRDAVEIALDKLPDLILMDIKMHVLNGIEATKILKAHVKTFNIPVIAVTATAFLSNQDQHDCRCFDGFVLKPIDTNELLAQLRLFLNHTITLNSGARKILQQLPEFNFDIHCDAQNILKTKIIDHCLFLKHRKAKSVIIALIKDLQGLGNKFEIKYFVELSEQIKQIHETYNIERLDIKIEQLLYLISHLECNENCNSHRLAN